MSQTVVFKATKGESVISTFVADGILVIHTDKRVVTSELRKK